MEGTRLPITQSLFEWSLRFAIDLKGPIASLLTRSGFPHRPWGLNFVGILVGVEMEIELAQKKAGEKESEIDRRARLKWEAMIQTEQGREFLGISVSKEVIGKLPGYYYHRSIDIGHFKRKKGFHNMGSIGIEHWKSLIQIDGKDKPPKELFFIHAVDKKDNTIVIRIHLDRAKKHIHGDLKILLGVLDKQAEFYGIKFGRGKHHLDKLERDVEIYKRQSEGKHRKEIALEKFKPKTGEELMRAKDRTRKASKKAKELIEKEYHKL